MIINNKYNIKRYIFLLLNFLLFSGLSAQSLKSDTINVINYEINLDLVFLSKKQLKGFTKISLTPKKNNLQSFTLDLLKLTVDSVSFGNNNLVYSYNDTILKINLPTPKNIGDTFSLTVHYRGTPVVEPYGWGGFHFLNDSSLAYNLGVAFYDYPHNYGRVWFPCIDDFVDRATYDFYIRVKTDKTVVCGGMQQSSVNHGDGTKTVHWKLTQTIPTYLASLAVSNYLVVDGSYTGLSGTIPTTLYVKPADTLKARQSFANLNDMLAIYENRFGPYRWPRVGFVSTVKGAMEHATNIAIPDYMFNGNLTYEWLFAHELSHNWFGNLITCSSAEDMWINEGWAVYCEALFMEGKYGTQSFKDYVRTNHEDVLQKAHTPLGDGSYLAVYGIPLNLTYGTTVYDKGGSMAHTLRGYLGDSLFFNTIRQMLNDYAFQPISSIQMRDYISTKTGINMNDWFSAWIFTPGFPHFSVDSFKVTPSGPNFEATVFVRQKAKGTTNLANSNRIEVTFMDENWNIHKALLQFSGLSGNQKFTIPFFPKAVMLDLDEKLCDATTDLYQTIKTTGVKTFQNTKFSLDVKQVTDSAFVRVEHNWVAPDPLKFPLTGLTLSDYRYWKIDGIFPSGFTATGRFQYNKSGYLDNTLLINPADSILILYREKTSDEWKPVSFTKIGTSNVGTIYVDNLKRGEYTLAVLDKKYAGIFKNPHTSTKVKIKPNPSAEAFVFEFKTTEEILIKIFDSKGSLIDSMVKPINEKETKWSPQHITNGVFYVHFINEKNQIIATDKLIFNKQK